MRKSLILSFGLLFLFIFASRPQSVSASNPLPLNTELSITLTQFMPVNSDYRVTDTLLSGIIMNLNLMPDGFKLNKEGTVLDLSAFTAESDSSLISGSDYSKTFINNTVNAVVETEDVAGAGTEVTAVTSGTADTLMTGAYHANGSLTTAKYTSNIYWDSNSDGDFVGTGDRAYYPLSSTSIFFLVSLNCNQNVTSTTDFCGVNLIFETAGTDYEVSIRQYMGAGDSGWSFATDNNPILSYYDADNIWITSIIPLAEIISDDSASVTLKGLDQVQYEFNIDAINNQITLQSHNVAIFANWPSLTDRVDDDNDRDFNDAGNIFANAWDDNDLLQTAVTEGGTEAYDNTMPLLKDLSGSVTLSHNFRYLEFEGVVSIDPSSYSTESSEVSGAVNKYLTTETLVFDTRAINDFDTFTNVLTSSAVQLNVTIDDTTLYDSTDYEENLVSFTVDGISFFNTFKSAWSATTVADDSEIQYDITDYSTTTGSLQNVVLSYYTKTSWSVAGSAGTTSTSAAGGVIVASSGSNNMMLYGLIGIGAITAIGVLYLRSKDNRRRR